MANASIFAAFERMWQHIMNLFETKTDATLKLEKAKAYFANDYLDLYIWKKYTMDENSYALGERSTTTYQVSHKDTLSTQQDVKYSSSISVIDGVVSLVNPTSITINASNASGATSAAVLKGKFIQRQAGTGGITAPGIGKIVYIPSNATFEYGNNSTGGIVTSHWIAASVYQPVLTQELLGYVTDITANVYPSGDTYETDGMYYVGGNQIRDAIMN